MRKSDARPGRRENAALQTPTDLNHEGVEEISSALRQLLADVFALYVKTKNFHWHMSGPHFRDYHLLLDEHGEQRNSFLRKTCSESFVRTTSN